MKKLTEELRQKVGKMSDERLRQRLVQAGYREADVASFERADLLAYYAKVLLAETAYVPPPQRGEDVDVEEAAGGAGDADESDPSPGFYGEEGHMRFLALEERKLDEQRMQQEEQRQHRELEMMRLEEQRRQREEQNQMEQKRLEFEQMKRKEELEWKKTEKASRETPAAKIKIWGDALRNTISRMPTEGIDAVSWFVSVEKLFEQLSVPAELQSILIRPYFSESKTFDE